MTNQKQIFGEDLSNFAQIESGHWVAENFDQVFVSVERFESGEMPDRFKHIEFETASREQADEWNRKVAALRGR